MKLLLNVLSMALLISPSIKKQFCAVSVQVTSSASEVQDNGLHISRSRTDGHWVGLGLLASARIMHVTVSRGGWQEASSWTFKRLKFSKDKSCKVQDDSLDLDTSVDMATGQSRIATKEKAKISTCTWREDSRNFEPCKAILCTKIKQWCTPIV